MIGDQNMGSLNIDMTVTGGTVVQDEHQITVNWGDRSLVDADVNCEHIIKDVVTDDSEMKEFLFTLGCYKGELVTVISKLAENYVINIKDSRYSIDSDLAKAIII